MFVIIIWHALSRISKYCTSVVVDVIVVAQSLFVVLVVLICDRWEQSLSKLLVNLTTHFSVALFTVAVESRDKIVVRVFSQKLCAFFVVALKLLLNNWIHLILGHVRNFALHDAFIAHVWVLGDHLVLGDALEHRLWCLVHFERDILDVVPSLYLHLDAWLFDHFLLDLHHLLD